ncbi:MBL fold metallo-hydrolase [Pseudactinotalea suaedae]|uniref:MBL fold metallo-hydrolase n=1 Tax=Pseudactinotalea suaedae TaxID=1524924 RepID=UPI001F4F4343|nr:MBL fold metallo-hydrolase [Pseudactinotalea suaedae]
MLSVLNVGDGACSVIADNEGEHLVLDCGSWRSGGALQAQILAYSLGRRLSKVTTLVVSHFDADHWKGLRALPTVAQRAHLPKQIAIRYPGLSRVGRETTAAFMALRMVDDGVSLRAQDLIGAWRPVAEVDAQPMFAGEQLELGDQTFDVVWPPRILPDSWSRAARRTLEELSALAEDLPELKRALNEAYEDAWSGAVGDETTDGPTGGGPNQVFEEPFEHEGHDGYLGGLNEAQRARVEGDVAWDLAANGVWGEAPLPEWPHGSELPEHNAKGGMDRIDLDGQANGLASDYMAPEFSVDEESIPEPRSGLGQTGHTELFGPGSAFTEHRDRLRDLARRLGVLNNHLSLVLIHQEAGFVALGDVKGWSLQHVSGQLRKIGPMYSLALAPHHGTVRMPSDFPHVCMCVLQCGPSHALRSDRHVNSHQCEAFFATEVSGNLYRCL